MLHDDAMIVRLSISQWTARKFDKRVTTKVNDDYGADSDAGRYNMVLVAKESIKAITQAAGNARTYHYEQTLPWDDAGGRLLPSANFKDYSKGMRDREDAFRQAVREFVANYPEYREEARDKLNGMFNADDYPTAHAIELRYDYHVEIEPVPYSKDFRVSLKAADEARIKKEIDGRVKAREAEAMKDLFVRLHKVVGHFVEKISDPDAIFRDSLVNNLIELVGLLPRLNIADDPDLIKLTKEAEKSLCSVSPDNLRSQPEVRKEAASKAQDILDKMAGYVS